MKILVFDTETTGLPTEKNASVRDVSKWPHIILLSYVLYDTSNNELIEYSDKLVKIPYFVYISPESENIHKITREKCYRDGEDIFVALDAAASEFYKKNKYILNDKKKSLTTDELIDYWGGLIKNYPIISIEDPFDEDDINGFAKFTNLYGKNLQIVGDDLFVTSEKKLSEGIQKQAGNSILIKLNQVGTLTETLDTISKAKKHNFTTIISHRSGETEDNFISDLCVGINAGQIKTGSLSRSDRTSKYNQLLRIEEQLGEEAKFIGNEILDIINK